MAKTGSQARPPFPPPGRLRPLMRFARLPDRALATVRQVIEEDAEFRGRVALAADDAGLERAPWLWLVRPQGWSDELESFTEAADAAAEEVQAEREERNALKRLAAAESTSARTEAELARLQDANAELLAEIASERQSRRRSEVERDDLEAARRSADEKLAGLTETVDQLQARISALAADADEGGRRLSSMRQERDMALGGGRSAPLTARRGRGRSGPSQRGPGAHAR